MIVKKLIAVGAVALLAVALLASPGTAGKGKGKQQKVEGSILLPAPFTDDTGCYAGVHRRLNAAFMGNHNGLLGYSFPVDKATWNKPFMLEASGQGDVDLDIYFYLGPLTTADDVIAAGGDPAPPATVSYNTRGEPGEHDIVPKLAENVILCMYGGGQGAGFAADFVYTAGKGVKKPK